MRCLLFLVSCLSSGPCAGSAAAAGSGDQYELLDFAGGFSEALEAAFLVVDGLRGLVTAFCCTLVAFGAVLCTGVLRGGTAPSRAERLSDMMVFKLGVFILFGAVEPAGVAQEFPC